MRRGIFRSMRMEAGEEKGGWETGFYFLIFTDIVKMGWDTKLRPSDR